MAKNKSVKAELFEELAKDKEVIIGLDAKVPYFINSGHYGLNMALSGRWLGGWAAGTVSELFGDPSCVVAGTRVALSDGSIVPIENIAERHTQDISVDLQNDGKSAEAVQFMHYKKQQIIEVVLSNGMRIKGTHNHPILCGKKFIELKDLKEGTEVCTVREITGGQQHLLDSGFIKYESNKLGPRYHGIIPSKVTAKLAAVMGYVLGDGWVRVRKGGTAEMGMLVNEEEQDLVGIIVEYMRVLFREDAIISKRIGKDRLYKGKIFKAQQFLTNIVYSKHAIANNFMFLRDKRIPDLIFRSNNTVLASFLRWLFEADGCVFSKGRGRRSIALKTAYVDLAQDVQIALLRFGIQSRILEYNNRCFTVAVRTKKSMQAYAKFIGFASIKKKTRLAKLLEDIKDIRVGDEAGHKEFVKKIIYHTELRDVFDVHIPDGHRFMTNGIISHNSGKSLITSRMMISVQRKEIYPNEGCAGEFDLTDTFVLLDDTEKAYQDAFCRLQGMDVDDLVKFKSTKTIEKHFEEMEDKVTKIRKLSKKSPIAVCCDSISQLSTAHEVAEGMDKVDMSKAKKVHQAMRLYSDFIYSNMIVYMACSHVTDTMNMYGPKRAVKGGKGLAFQSTVRADVRYLSKFVRNVMDTVEAGERGEVYGVKILIEAVKNRVTAPFAFTVLDLYFSKGIDPYSGLFDYFTRKGKIEIKDNDKKKKNEDEVKDKKGKKIKKKLARDAVYVFDGKHEFKQCEFDELIIKEDLLGVRAAGYEYMPIMRIDESLDEFDLTEDGTDVFVPPPPPGGYREPMCDE